MGIYRLRHRGRRRRVFILSAPPGGEVIPAEAVDALDMAEATARRANLRPTAADALDAAEATGGRGVYRGTALDALGLAAALTPRRTLRAVAVEALGLAGGTGKRAGFQSSPVDLLELLATAAAGGRIPATAADGVEVSEGAAGGWRYARTAADTWLLTRTASGTATLRATAVDGIDLATLAEYPGAGESGELQLTPDADGKEDVTTGTIVLTNPQFNVRATTPYFAFRFENVDVPRGAVVDAATMDWYVDTYDDPGLTLRAELNAAAAALTTTAFDISSRTWTEAGVAWSAANVGSGLYVATPDFAAVLEEVFALPGWTRGASDLVVVAIDNGTGGRIQANAIDSTTNKPRLNISWHSGGLTITATAADLVAVLESAARRAIVAAATADSASFATASTAALSLLIAETWQLSETVAALARLTVNDAAVLGDGVYLTYALALTEPLDLFEAIQRIAALRAGAVDAAGYSAAARTTVSTAAGDVVEFSGALAARRVLAALAVDPLTWRMVVTGDMAGLLEAIAEERIDLGGAAWAGWRVPTAAGDAVEFGGAAATLRRLLGTAADGQAVEDVAAAMKRARAGAVDAAGLREALRTLARTRAVDGLELGEAAVEWLATLLHALAADGLALSAGATAVWRVTARDSLEFAAALANVMRWVEEVGDALGLSGATAFLLPNGIVRIEMGIMGASVAFEIAMPGAELALRQPVVEISGQ